MPIQTVAAQGVAGRIELDPAYEDALADLDGFTHLHLITYLHRTGGVSLRVTPYLDTVRRGVFATRSPKRPNPIGLSIVRLVRIEGAVIHIEEVDLLDGTPLLDIKPYVPPFDDRADARYGWFEQRAAERPQRARGRALRGARLRSVSAGVDGCHPLGVVLLGPVAPDAPLGDTAEGRASRRMDQRQVHVARDERRRGRGGQSVGSAEDAERLEHRCAAGEFADARDVQDHENEQHQAGIELLAGVEAAGGGQFPAEQVRAWREPEPAPVARVERAEVARCLGKRPPASAQG